MFDTILSLQPKVTKGKGKSREATIEELAKDILKRIPESIDIPGTYFILNEISFICSEAESGLARLDDHSAHTGSCSIQ